MKRNTTVERKSERELVVTRTFNARAHIVFEAWTRPDLLKRWWAPKSFGVSFISCEADVRAGGTYRFVFGHPASEQPMEFFGRYLEVTPHSRLVWIQGCNQARRGCLSESPLGPHGHQVGIEEAEAEEAEAEETRARLTPALHRTEQVIGVSPRKRFLRVFKWGVTGSNRRPAD
jgi:hypothetical protein